MYWRTPPEPIPAGKITREYTADVIIVGAGHAGTPAARAAAESGAEVIVIEKQKREKYRALGLDVGHINSQFLAEKGVPHVDPIEFFNDWMRRSGNRADPRLVMQFVKNCGETFDWYINVIKPEERAQMFVRYWPPSEKFDGELGGYKFWHGTAVMPGWFEPGKFSLTDVVMENLDYACGNFGAQVHFGMSAEQIVKENGRAAAIVAKDVEGNYARYNARRGIILATGGFAADSEMCCELLPDIYDLLDYAQDENGELLLNENSEPYKVFPRGSRDGIGIKLGVWAGGRLEPRPISTMGGNYASHMSGLLRTFGWLWLDSNGKRYSNEAFGDPVIAALPGAKLKHDTYFTIFGSNALEYAQYAPPAHTGFWPTDEASVKELEETIRRTIEAGDEGYNPRMRPGSDRNDGFFAGDTPEQLAQRMGLTGEVYDNVVASIKRYNELCRAGRDEDFGKDEKLMMEMKPPYIGLTCSAGMIGNIMDTTGGLLTDERQNVLDLKKNPIPGLYASGNCCGGRFGTQYTTPISGVSIGMAITLGRIAGQNAAAG